MLRTRKSGLGLRVATLATLLAILPISHKAAAQVKSAQAFLLHSFSDSPDGADPFQSPLFRDSGGNLYGTTLQGGSDTNGTIFKVSSAGIETVLYRFQPDQNGRAPSPMTGVIGDDTGNLYGTATFGGSAGYGTVFKLDATGKLTILYAFTAGTDGRSPYGGLVRDSNDNLFGTAAAAGNLRGCGNGCGTVLLSIAGQKVEDGSVRI
jgi:uncharacterized repeat protein (TIGR03803 family)